MFTPKILKTFGKVISDNPAPALAVGMTALGGGIGYLRSARGYDGKGWIIADEDGNPIDRNVVDGVKESNEDYAKRVGISKKQMKRESDLTWDLAGGKPLGKTLKGVVSGAIASAVPLYLAYN